MFLGFELAQASSVLPSVSPSVARWPHSLKGRILSVFCFPRMALLVVLHYVANIVRRIREHHQHTARQWCLPACLTTPTRPYFTQSLCWSRLELFVVLGHKRRPVHRRASLVPGSPAVSTGVPYYLGFVIENDSPLPLLSTYLV